MLYISVWLLIERSLVIIYSITCSKGGNIQQSNVKFIKEIVGHVCSCLKCSRIHLGFPFAKYSSLSRVKSSRIIYYCNFESLPLEDAVNEQLLVAMKSLQDHVTVFANKGSTCCSKSWPMKRIPKELLVSSMSCLSIIVSDYMYRNRKQPWSTSRSTWWDTSKK